MNARSERSPSEEGALSARRERPVQPAQQAAANLGEVARDVLDHAKIIARDAVALGRLEVRRTVDRARTRARDAAPRIAFAAIAGVTALVGLVFVLIAIFIALGDPIPSVGWRMAIFGAFFLVTAVIGATFATSHEERPVEETPARVFRRRERN